jgi:hypothetical protein
MFGDIISMMGILKETQIKATLDSYLEELFLFAIVI